MHAVGSWLVVFQAMCRRESFGANLRGAAERINPANTKYFNEGLLECGVCRRLNRIRIPDGLKKP